MNPCPVDVRKLFYKVKYTQGTDIARTFCGLNDPRNIIPSIGYAHEATRPDGTHMISQCCLCITESPIHTVEYYVTSPSSSSTPARTKYASRTWRASAVP